MATLLRVLKKIRKETVVYIPKGGVQEDGSTSLNYAGAREIKVRWEDDSIEYLTATGETEQSRAVVYVGEDFNISDYLFKGTLSDFNDIQEDQKKTHPNMYEIRGHKKLPKLDYGDFLRIVFLGPFN